jgi:predicted RNA methylase
MDKLEEISVNCNIDGLGFEIEDNYICKNTVVSTYGEILPESIGKILKKIKIKDSDIFYDLGSGTGRVCFQIYLEKNIKCIGIEYVKNRYDLSVISNNKLENSKITFINDDFFNINWRNATIIYICNTCHPMDLMNKIVNKITEECKDLRYLILCKNLETIPNNFRLIKEFNVKSSWSDYSRIFIYKIKYDYISVSLA